MEDKFWSNLEELVEKCELVIDRPKGSAHPRYPSAIYPIDYGYLKGTSGGDGQGVDVWRGSLASDSVDSVVCTIDGQKRDAEIKILLGCSEDDKKKIDPLPKPRFRGCDSCRASRFEPQGMIGHEPFQRRLRVKKRARAPSAAFLPSQTVSPVSTWRQRDCGTSPEQRGPPNAT
jgi:inorganic pyrophosphatase